MKYLLLLIYSLEVFILSRNYFLFFQLDSYQYPSFFKTIRRNYQKCLLPAFILAAILFGESIIYLKLHVLYCLFLDIFILLVMYLFRKRININKAKKDLVITNRIKRLSISYFIFLYLFFSISYFSNLIFLVGLLSLLIFCIAGLIAWPIEKIISEFYFSLAKIKLKQFNHVIKIGITGSYGKTSTKNILASILNSYTPTLASPRSYNTPMGLTITIRNFLTSSYRIFIAEMGSRHIGDINKLCKLIHPTIGIITAVGPQHLDTFKNVDNVAKGKYELISNLPINNGVAFFQDDKSIVKELYTKTKHKKYLASIYDSNADIYIGEICTNSNGSNFTVYNNGIKELSCTTSLLGINSIKNIAISIAVAKYLGVPNFLIKKAVSELKPVKSRLELINNQKYTIINDAFNSNVVGSKEALQVLSSFDSRKIIITPGMVELGDQEYNINYEFGVEIAKTTDIAILVGKSRIIPIKQGILDAGFNRNNLYTVNSLDDSTKLLNSIVLQGDVVLYENDLPDNYIDA